MKFNEDSRVKIPSILHLMRLGYKYLSLKDPSIAWDESTNIFTDIFHQSVKRINPLITDAEAKQLLDDVSLSLENEDLGKAFYQKLTNKSGERLIDFENFDNNTFNVVTELTYQKDEDEFRPNIILLINGMPLVFKELTTNQGFKSFIPNKGFASNFIFFSVKNSMKAIIQYSSGSTFKEVSGSVLKTVKVCLPKLKIAESYSIKVNSIFKRQNLLEEENQKLTELRDWLLPMLMNGQVTVK